MILHALKCTGDALDIWITSLHPLNKVGMGFGQAKRVLGATQIYTNPKDSKKNYSNLLTVQPSHQCTDCRVQNLTLLQLELILTPILKATIPVACLKIFEEVFTLLV